jgi:hypothetical protein
MSKRFVDPAFFAPGCLVFLISLIWLLSGPVHAQSQPQAALAGKNVLILHSHEANAPVFLGTDKGLSKTFQSGGIPSLNQFFESLDLRRNPGPEYRKLLVEQMRVQYSHRKLDIIITMYPEALEFVLKDCRDVLPHVPILALQLPKSFEGIETDRPIIGHASTVDITGTIEIALKLVPGAKRVYVVSGVHEVDKRVEDQARRDLKKWETRLEFIYLSHMSFEDMLATMGQRPYGPAAKEGDNNFPLWQRGNKGDFANCRSSIKSPFEKGGHRGICSGPLWENPPTPLCKGGILFTEKL